MTMIPFIREQRSHAMVIILALMLLITGPVKADTDIQLDGLRLPSSSTPASVTSKDFAPYAGFWLGTWDGLLKHAFYIESVGKDGIAAVIYAIAANPRRNTPARWLRMNGRVDGNTLVVSNDRFESRYTKSKTGRLKGVFAGGSGFVILQRQNFADLISKKTKPQWSVGNSTLLDTALVEGGKQVRLESINYSPPGNGPFRLAIINHGSTGSGKDADSALLSWKNDWLAETLNEYGWFVSFPQRRGRGRSDGLYDEGFSKIRTNGYTCDQTTSLAGADRALADIKAAEQALRALPSISSAPILIGGQSRGGALSLAYAGDHPNRVVGVINFVGGWLGEGCPTAKEVNQKLFKRGGNFPRETLSIYGAQDPYYSITHSKQNFSAFTGAGGKGKFQEVKVRGENNGHYALFFPPLWAELVEDYLSSLD